MEPDDTLVSYNHLVTGGSGVLVGAQTGQVQATVERTLSPKWQASVSIGYATNTSLIPTAASSSSKHYNSWYAVVRLNHQMRPGTDLFLELRCAAAGGESRSLHDSELRRQLH